LAHPAHPYWPATLSLVQSYNELLLLSQTFLSLSKTKMNNFVK